MRVTPGDGAFRPDARPNSRKFAKIRGRPGAARGNRTGYDGRLYAPRTVPESPSQHGIFPMNRPLSHYRVLAITILLVALGNPRFGVAAVTTTAPAPEPSVIERIREEGL